ncbi:hypothetical protein RCL1_006972 [Eukaryota sp. TZLM3-RCL]
MLKLYVHVDGSAPFMLEVPPDCDLDQLHDLAKTSYLELYEKNPHILQLRRACKFASSELLLIYDKIDIDPDAPIDISLQEKLHIYEEPEPSPKSPILIPCPESKISKLVPKLATLNRIILILTEKQSENYLLDVFFLTFDIWTTPDIVLKKLLHRYEVPLPPCLSSHQRNHWFASTLQPIQRSTAKAIYKFLELRPEVFTPEMKNLVEKFATVQLVNDGHGIAGQKLKNLIDCERSDKVPLLPESLCPPGTQKTKSFWEHDVTEQSKVLTFCDLQSYICMQPADFFGQKYAKQKHLVPAIVRNVELFNQLSNFVTCSILKPKDSKIRKQILTKAAQLAIALYNENSFNLMSAVVGGLTNPAIKRITTLNQSLSPHLRSKITELSQLMNPKGNYKMYRAILRSLPSSAVVSPWLGVFFRDLTFIEDGNPKIVNNQLNFYRVLLSYNTVLQCLYWQESARKLDLSSVDFSVIYEVQHHEQIDEKMLFAISLEILPRNQK